MKLSELTAYAEEKYHIAEQPREDGPSGFSVLAHPNSGNWVAVLMRQWDGETGEELEFCDLKCGHGELRRSAAPFLTAPFRMRGADWVGIRFGEEAERATVLRLFDEAMDASRTWG